MAALIFLIVALVLFFLDGCGISTVHVGSVTFHTLGFGLFAFILSGIVGGGLPRKGN